MAALAVSLVLLACSPEEASQVGAINAFREGNGVATLAWEEGAYAKVRAWSQKMADDGRLSHSTLSQGVPTGWRVLGENVAMNSTLEGAMTALTKSPTHRANLLNPRFTRVAVGVVHQDGRYWVTQLFIG